MKNGAPRKPPSIPAKSALAGMFGIPRDITERQQSAAILKQQGGAMNQRNAGLARFNRVMVGRKLAIFGLKPQVNALSHELGRALPFALNFAKAPNAGAPQ